MPTAAPRAKRADAQRNLDAILESAKTVFQTSGVDAPVREIAAHAGVGVGTMYRHFPQRSDLVKAVYFREVDACVAEAPLLRQELAPADALAAWLRRFTVFVAAKRGLAAALHSGDPAFAPLPVYFNENLVPALASLLDPAVEAGVARPDVDPSDLLGAVSNLCMSGDPARSAAMVDLLIAGLLLPAPAVPED